MKSDSHEKKDPAGAIFPADSDQAFWRIRNACAADSPLDVDRHALLVWRAVVAARARVRGVWRRAA